MLELAGETSDIGAARAGRVWLVPRSVTNAGVISCAGAGASASRAASISVTTGNIGGQVRQGNGGNGGNVRGSGPVLNSEAAASAGPKTSSKFSAFAPAALDDDTS